MLECFTSMFQCIVSKLFLGLDALILFLECMEDTFEEACDAAGSC
jgi:hypothetical protein